MIPVTIRIRRSLSPHYPRRLLWPGLAWRLYQYGHKRGLNHWISWYIYDWMRNGWLGSPQKTWTPSQCWSDQELYIDIVLGLMLLQRHRHWSSVRLTMFSSPVDMLYYVFKGKYPFFDKIRPHNLNFHSLLSFVSLPPPTTQHLGENYPPFICCFWN